MRWSRSRVGCYSILIVILLIQSDVLNASTTNVALTSDSTLSLNSKNQASGAQNVSITEGVPSTAPATTEQANTTTGARKVSTKPEDGDDAEAYSTDKQTIGPTDTTVDITGESSATTTVDLDEDTMDEQTEPTDRSPYTNVDWEVQVRTTSTGDFVTSWETDESLGRTRSPWTTDEMRFNSGDDLYYGGFFNDPFRSTVANINSPFSLLKSDVQVWIVIGAMAGAVLLAGLVAVTIVLKVGQQWEDQKFEEIRLRHIREMARINQPITDAPEAYLDDSDADEGVPTAWRVIRHMNAENGENA